MSSKKTLPGSVMSIMDYVYLGLIGVAALVAYCHGFFAGVRRSRRVYEALLNSTEPELPHRDEASRDEDEPNWETAIHRPPPSYPGRQLRGDFGNN